MLRRTIVNGLRGLVAAAVVYPLAERFERRHVGSKYRALAREMTLPFARRRQRSWAALVDTVRFAGAHVPYYRDLFAHIRFDPDDLARDPNYLQDIPYLTKEMIRSEGSRLLRDDRAEFRKHVSKTGGSTGASVQIFYDQEAADWSSAVTRYARSTIGGDCYRSELHFASRFPEGFPLRDRIREHIKCLAMNRHNVVFSSFDPDELRAIRRKIDAIRPYLVHAHPSTMFQLALLAEPQPAGRQIAVFESSGELLTPRQRAVIAERFGCAVIDRYGLAEIGVVAYQLHRREDTLQIFDPFCWPEVVAEEDGAQLADRDDANSGELVITALRNRLMPLLRYRTGDLASMSETDEGFIIQQLVGRIHDVVEIGGRRIPTQYIQDVLNRVAEIEEFQVEVGGDRPVLHLVTTRDADREAIRKRLLAWWDHAVDITFIESCEIELQGSRSKFRHLIASRPVLAVAADAEVVSST